MKKKILQIGALFLLGLTNGWLFGQIAPSSGGIVGLQVFKQEPAPGQSYSVNTALALSERREYTNIYFESDSAAGAWSTPGGGNQVTFSVPSGHTIHSGDVIKTQSFSNIPFFSQVQCRVSSVTSTSVTVDNFACNGGLPAGGLSGTETTGYIQKVSGTCGASPCDQTVTYEAYSTTGTETFYLMDKPKANFNGSGTCTLAKAIAHDPSCYTAHPIMTAVLAGPGVYAEVGTTSGTCSSTGGVETGDLALHSTNEFDVKATSAQDPTKTHISHYLVCANGADNAGHPSVLTADPGTMQLFPGQSIPLACNKFGSATFGCNWSLDSTDNLAASGTAPTLVNATGSMGAALTAGTKGGGYIYKACDSDDATNCAKIRVWIAKTQTPPAGNLDGVIIYPCEIDPVMSAFGGEIMEVGPTGHGFTYNDVMSLPLNTGQWHWGLTIRIHNEFSTPGSPFTIANYWGLNAPANIGPSDGSIPIANICGIPNPTSGELPKFDGTNSHGASWLNTITQAGASWFAALTSDTRIFYTKDPLATNHIRLSNVRVDNITPGVPYVDPSGGASSWGNSSLSRFYGYSSTVVAGVRAVNVAMPFFGDCNPQQSGWKNCSKNAYYIGNHCEAYGINGQPTEHCFYDQSLVTNVFATWEEGTKSGSGGATGCYSFRGVTRVTYAFNKCVPKSPYDSGSGPGGDSENQDAFEYMSMRDAFGPQGLSPAAACSLGSTTAPFCPLPTHIPGSVNTYAAFVEAHHHTFFNYGNITFMNAGAAVTSIAPTHDLNDLTSAVNLYFYHNTNRSISNYPVNLFEDRRNFRGNAESSTYPVYWPGAEFQNNDIWNNNNAGCSYGGCGPDIKYWSSGEINYTTNIIRTGQFTLNTNIPALLGFDQGNNGFGVRADWDYGDFTGTNPINGHKGGWTAPNFVAASTDPVSSSTYIPASGSPDIGVASTLVWPMNYAPPLFNAVNPSTTDPNNGFTLRTDFSTVGASDPSGAGPTPVSVAVTPNPLSTGISTSGTLTCTTTLSDSTTRACISPSCSSTNTASMTISGLNWTATATTGSGNLNCSAESLTAPADAFTVTGGGPTPVSIAVTPNPLSGSISSSGSLVCTTTMSSGGPHSCISPVCTSTNTATLTISGLNWTSTATPGTGTINCAAESLTAPGDAFTITGGGISPSQIFGSGAFSGAGVIQN